MSVTHKDLEKAIKIAVDAHFGQADKAGAPYIFHPLRVMAACDTIDEKMVAVLHDVVEDTQTTVDDLAAEGLPHHVTNAINVLTRRNDETYDDFIERVRQNPLATVVKIADLSDNLDITRLSVLMDDDIARLAKYHKALRILKG